MSIVGFQDFWVAGSRFYFKRDDEGAVKYPFEDLGVILSATPTIASEKVTLMDADGGIKRIVDEALTSIDESYEVTTPNLNLENLAHLFLANAPSAFTQVVTEHEVTESVHPGELVKIKSATGTYLYGLGVVSGVMIRDLGGDLTEVELTAMSKSAKTITVTGLLQSEFDAGDQIVVRRLVLANPLNAKTYTVVSALEGGGSTVITVEEEPVADEVAISGLLIYKADSGDSGTILNQDTDWEVVSLDRGIIRIIDGGAVSAEDNLVVISQTAALSGLRKINPHDISGEIVGTAMLVMSRNRNSEQTVREMRVSVTPSSLNLTADDFSNMALTVKVLADPDNETEPAGRLLQFKGTLPSKS